MDTKRYLSRMRDDYKARAIKRGEELAKKKEEVNKKIEEEKAKSRAQVLKQREEERKKHEEEEGIPRERRRSVAKRGVSQGIIHKGANRLVILIVCSHSSTIGNGELEHGQFDAPEGSTFREERHKYVGMSSPTYERMVHV